MFIMIVFDLCGISDFFIQMLTFLFNNSDIAEQ